MGSEMCIRDRSWSFIEGFIADNDLAVEVYAAVDWDKGSNKLQICLLYTSDAADE